MFSPTSDVECGSHMRKRLQISAFFFSHSVDVFTLRQTFSLWQDEQHEEGIGCGKAREHESAEISGRSKCATRQRRQHNERQWHRAAEEWNGKLRIVNVFSFWSSGTVKVLKKSTFIPEQSVHATVGVGASCLSQKEC